MRNKYIEAFNFYADQQCGKCRGIGYLNVYQHISQGRCFSCLSDNFWDGLCSAEYPCTSNKTGKVLCLISKVPKSKYFGEDGFIVVDPQVKCLSIEPDFKIYRTREDAFRYAESLFPND